MGPQRVCLRPSLDGALLNAPAETYYKLSVPGDPVTITGSPRGGTWGNGWTVWFLTWRQLLEGSALGQAVRTGPSGSSFVDPATVPPSRAKPPLGVARAGNSASTNSSST